MRIEVPWIPSPVNVINEALKLACVSRDDIVCDLGAGDGRVVIIAAKDRGARGIAIEANKVLCGLIEVLAKLHGVEDRVKVICNSYYDIDITEASVLYLYLYPSILNKLREKIEEEAKDGTRVVVLDFAIADWIPILTKRVLDDKGIVRTIRLYIIGLSNYIARIKRFGEIKEEIANVLKRIFKCPVAK